LFAGHDYFVWPELPRLVVFLGLCDDDVSFAEVDIVYALYDKFAWSPSDVETVGEDVRNQRVFVVVIGESAMQEFVDCRREWYLFYFCLWWTWGCISPEVCVDAEGFGEGFDGFPFVDNLVFSSFVFVVDVFSVLEVVDDLYVVEFEPVHWEDGVF